jgi:DNA repair exonuclease SbcCD ATPase subunit
MKLLSIEVQNFKKLRDFRADFTDGLNTIIGDNWAGKTTLLHAVVTGLYGLTAIPGKKEDIPTWGQKNFKIKMVIEHDNCQYLIERDLRNGKITTMRGDQEEVVASGNTTCTKFIEELLGLAFKDFALFILSMQGETAGVLTFGATALQKRVEAFSGAEVIDSVLVAVRQQMGVLKASAASSDPEAVKAEITPLEIHRAELEGKIAKAEEELDALSRTIATYRTDDDQLKATEVSLRERIAGLERERRELDNLKFQAREYQSALESAEEDLAALPEVPDLGQDESDVDAMRKGAKEARKFAQQWQNTLDRKAELEVSLPKLREAADEEEVLAGKVPPAEQIKAALAADADAYQEVLTLQKHIAKLKQELKDGVCSACDRPFEDHNPAEIQQKIDGAYKQLIEAEAVRTETENAANTLQSREKKYGRYLSGMKAAEYKAAEMRLAELEQAVIGNPADAIEQAEQMERTAAELEARIAGAEQLARNRAKLFSRVEELRTKLEDAIAQGNEVQSRCMPGTLDTLKEQLADVERQRECFAEEIAKLAPQQVELSGHLRTLSVELAGVGNRLEQLVQQLNQLRRTADDFDRHKRLEKFLVESRTEYLKQVWDQILGVASAKVAISTAGAIRRIARDENGGFVAEETGKWVPIANCSGAQKGHIGVAMRVGLSAALYGNTGLLILDEPTEAMNDQNALQLAGALMGIGGQCVMITHRPFEQLAAQNVIHVGQ